LTREPITSVETTRYPALQCDRCQRKHNVGRGRYDIALIRHCISIELQHIQIATCGYYHSLLRDNLGLAVIHPGAAELIGVMTVEGAGVPLGCRLETGRNCCRGVGLSVGVGYVPAGARNVRRGLSLCPLW
jgi:hypothetical protein